MSTNRTEITSKIEELEQQLETIGTRQTEVYARIVGYYRSVKNWNKGKKAEYQVRSPYIYEGDESIQCRTLDYRQDKQSEEELVENTQPELMLQSNETENI